MFATEQEIASLDVKENILESNSPLLSQPFILLIVPIKHDSNPTLCVPFVNPSVCLLSSVALKPTALGSSHAGADPLKPKYGQDACYTI